MKPFKKTILPSIFLAVFIILTSNLAYCEEEKLTLEQVKQILSSTKVLSGRNLSKMNLSGLDLSDADLRGANLNKANYAGLNA
jgi:uncharacterized protein YjbI with pentapeptide repeats